MTNEPLVSVIIPVYNRGHLLGRTIESVLGNNYDNLEIIIVDDASTEDIKTVVNNIGDQRLKYIRHGENLGGANARNTGIDAATGSYVAFLDSDDVWLPNKLKLQLDLIQNHGEHERVVVHTQFNYYNGYVTRVLPARARRLGEALGDYLFVSDGAIHTSTLLMSRELAVKTKFKSGLRKHQDLDFCFRLEEMGAIFELIDQSLVTWYAELDRKDRITNKRNLDFSISWIYGYESTISRAALVAFLMREVVTGLVEYENQKIAAEKIIWEAFTLNLIPLKEFIRLTLFALTPPQLRRTLKGAIKKYLLHQKSQKA